jgi:hypothetical protein
VDLLELIINTISRLVGAAINGYAALLHILEGGLRAPLAHFGATGLLQTTLVAMVPILTLIAAVKLLGGIIRVIVVVLVASFLVYIVAPSILAIRI